MPGAIGPYSSYFSKWFLYTSVRYALILHKRISNDEHPGWNTPGNKNLKAILTEAVRFDAVVKTSIFLQSMNDFQAWMKFMLRILLLISAEKPWGF